MKTFFLENSAWLIGIGGILSLVGAILAGVQQGIEADASNALLKETNETVAINKQLTVNIQEIGKSNEALTNKILHLNSEIKKISKQNFVISEDISKITNSTKEYITGKNSYCSLIYTISEDTIFFFIRNKNINPIRDIDARIEYGHVGALSKKQVTINVLYNSFEREVLSFVLDKEKPLIVNLYVHSSSGFFTQNLGIIHIGNKWEFVNLVKDEENATLENEQSYPFPDDILKKLNTFNAN